MLAFKRRFVASCSVFPRYLFWLLLFFSTALVPATAFAVSENPFPESPMDMNIDVPGEINYCKPAEITLYDKSIRAGLLYDVSANAVVWEKNKEKAFPIASLTKMMVALIAVEDIFEGKVDLDTIVKVTPEAAKMTGSKVYLRTGCCVSVEELLKAALISSGNDAAYLLAQFLGGTESAFVTRMNERAAQLGMKDTRYSNSTGMPAADSANDNHSSPSDLLILSLEMLKYKDLLEIAGMSDAVITQDKRSIRLKNHNSLVATYEDVDGFKTGFTQNAKYCLVATANKDGRRLISIVLGASSLGVRKQFTATAISRYYEALGMGGLELKTCIAAARDRKTTSGSTIAKTSAVAGGGAAAIYQVKRGDTLYKIARKYGCGVSELKAWNQIRGNMINPGQKLAIHPVSSTFENKMAVKDNIPAVKNAESGAVVHHYTVRQGDTLWEIAKKFKGVTVKDIMKANRIKRAKALKPGTTLKIVMDA